MKLLKWFATVCLEGVMLCCFIYLFVYLTDTPTRGDYNRLADKITIQQIRQDSLAVAVLSIEDYLIGDK